MTEPENNMTTNSNDPQLLRIVQRFNDVTGCEYSDDGFLWDLHRLEPTVSAFKAGWDESESEGKRLLTVIIDQYDSKPDGPLGRGFTNGPFLAAKEYLKKTT
jgi:hypothetical protein